MTIPDWISDAARSRYAELSWTDYRAFDRWVRSIVEGGAISRADAEELLTRFPNPRPVRVPEAPEEEGTVVYLTDPPDVGPLAQFRNHGWVDDATAVELRFPVTVLRCLLEPLADQDVLIDIQENALHILGRCNCPRPTIQEWGENRQGLVYGMVQSGKTANMITLIALAAKAGYRLFIILAGDKSSLRDQTQSRINRAFDLTHGANRESPFGMVQSPTWEADYRSTGLGFSESFRYSDIRGRGYDWSTIIVIKKQTNHLRQLIGHLEMLKAEMEKDGKDLGSRLPALIIDDEADYASPNTDVYGNGNRIHNDIVDLRVALPRNTYIGYTATPQACLSADTGDVVGYPKDFLWLLEPFVEEAAGTYRTRSYLGAWEVFWEYDRWLLHRMGRNEWPHHEKDVSGKSLGIYVPPPKGNDGDYTQDQRLTELERTYLEEVLDGSRPSLPSLRDALLDFIIGCGVQWWREWRRENKGDYPSKQKIAQDYPHHSAMVHLSLSQDNQELIRRLVQRQWHEAVDTRQGFRLSDGPPDDPFRVRWRLQMERTAELFPEEGSLPFDQIAYFIDKCIEIAEEPIFDYRQVPYRPFSGSPFVYLINSSDEGTGLFYTGGDPQIRAKKASIVVGGNILTRGLTIEGLNVTVFGRTARLPLGDASLQMGRWFGHKMASLDTISIFMQDGVRNVFRQVAEADRYLRRQIKQAVVKGHRPSEVLLELRNSRFFRITSPSKSVFLQDDGGFAGWAGKEALLKEASFAVDDILHNMGLISDFQRKHASDGAIAMERAWVYRDVDPWEVIRLFRSLRCPDDISSTTFNDYAAYLQDWLNGKNLPPFPRINVGIAPHDGSYQRRREFRESKPTSAAEARSLVLPQFGSIVGGESHAGYRGDAFLDRDEAWHRSVKPSSSSRGPGDDILVVMYKLDPNYVTRNLWDPSKRDWIAVPPVYLQPGDSMYVHADGVRPDDLFVLSFAAWTPSGGPMYGVKTNSLIDVAGLRQRGLDQVRDSAEG